MNNQKIILIIAGILVTLGAVAAYFIYNNSSMGKAPLFRIQNEVANSNVEKCVIIVRGEKYDVSDFRNKHKGGNIFKCNEDMTEAFNKQHGDKQFKDLQKYKITE